MTLLTVMGALYLAWPGINMFRHPPSPISIGEEVGQISWRSAAMKGVLVNGPNPKAFMFFLAYHLSFTVSDAAWQIPTQLFTLGMVYTVSCSVVYMLVGYGARIVLSTRPTAACFVSRESGSMMLLLGAFLLYSLYSQFYIINLAGSQLLFRKFRRFQLSPPQRIFLSSFFLRVICCL